MPLLRFGSLSNLSRSDYAMANLQAKTSQLVRPFESLQHANSNPVIDYDHAHDVLTGNKLFCVYR